MTTDRTNYFFDTEFIEDGKTIDLISIGIATEDGREFYAVNREARLDLASDWVREHVLPKLPPYGDPAWMPRAIMRERLLDFVHTAPKPRFWAYYADYDWVALCQLFGRMIDLPPHFPMFCMDLKQLSVMKGDPKHPPQGASEHDALEDARWNRTLYEFLIAQPDPEHRELRASVQAIHDLASARLRNDVADARALHDLREIERFARPWKLA